MAAFAAHKSGFKDQASTFPEFKLIVKDLIRIFNKNNHWNATELSLSDAINTSVGIAVLKVKNDRFIGDVGDIIRMKIESELE